MHDSLISKIKEKKELSGISSKVIESLLEDYVRKHKINISGLSKKEEKFIIKEIRDILRKYAGRFYKSQKHSEEYLEGHLSTSERKEFYPILKKIISKVNPSSILDLACGLNPLAIASKNIFYYASDIDEANLEKIRKYFSENSISGEVFFCDLRNPPDSFPQADLCLIFKALDIIDDKKHKISENIIRRLNSKITIVSFATKKLSGKKMAFPQRFWFEKMLSRLNLKFRKINSPNEVFYIISKDEIKEELLE